MKMQRCECCGAIQWSRYPRSRHALAQLRKRGRMTSRELADHAGISIQNANNTLRNLEAAGFARVVDTEANPGGGIFHIYAPTREVQDG